MAAQARTTKHADSIVDDRVLDPQELLERIPLHRSTVYRMVQEGRFPPPIQLTPSRIGWRWSAVLQWLNAREAGNPTSHRPRARKDGKNVYGADHDKNKPTEAA